MARNDQRPMRIGIIGLGGWGASGHLNAFLSSPHAEIVAVCDVVPGRADEVAQQFDVESAFTDYRDLLRLPNLDAVDIATPNKFHREITLAALAAGKHVLCEKPLALTVEHAQEMTDAAAKAGVHAAVNFVHRFVPSARYVKQLIDEGALGKIYHCNLVYEQGWLTDPHFPRTWRLDASVAGTGVLGDLGVHLIDLARWWLSTEITSVSGRLTTFTPRRPLPGAPVAAMPRIANSAVSGVPVDPSAGLVDVDVDDEAAFLATFANGAQGMIFSSRNCPGYRNYQRVEIFGSDGGLIFDNEKRGTVEASLGGSMWRRNAWAVLPVPRDIMRDDAKGGMHYFAEDVVTGSHNAPTFADGLAAQKVMDAVVRSARSRAWVDIA